MAAIIDEITRRVERARHTPDVLDVLFGIHKSEALQAPCVILFGAGALGQEMRIMLERRGVRPIAFCDNDPARSGMTHYGLPVLSLADMRNSYRDSMIVIATQRHAAPITAQLLENGFDPSRVFCKDSDSYASMVSMYSMVGTQSLLEEANATTQGHSILLRLAEQADRIQSAYDSFSDAKSKELFLSKLSLFASGGSFTLFQGFMTLFSEPLHDFGFGNFSGTPEDYYYFNNEFLTPADGEVYIDVGAFDGDTVQSFMEACNKHRVRHNHIHAFEPDPQCYASLLRAASSYHDISCHRLGLWSSSTVLRFLSSEMAAHNQAGAISMSGDVEISVVSLDDFLAGEKATFIKMDPGGNVIPQAVTGASATIARYKPKLALGAYHSLEAIFEVPLLVRSICPEYRLYLRHNTFHLSDTDLYALAN